MVHQLVVPGTLAGVYVECDQAGAEQVVTRAKSAIEIKGRTVGRYVDNAALLVGRHWRPGRNIAGPLPGIVFPGVVSELARSRKYVELPQELAGFGVVTQDIAWNILDA